MQIELSGPFSYNIYWRVDGGIASVATQEMMCMGGRLNYDAYRVERMLPPLSPPPKAIKSLPSWVGEDGTCVVRVLVLSHLVRNGLVAFGVTEI